MIRLDLLSYNKKLEHEHSRTQYPQSHYYEDNEMFILLFKSREGWEYYTVIFKKDIIEAKPNEENIIDEFRIDYCSNALRIMEIQNFEFPLYSKKIREEEEYQQEELEEQTIRKTVDIVDYTDIVEDSIDYSDFLEKLFNGFEKQVLKGLKKLDLKKSYIINKTFPDFLRDLFNAVNTVTFAKEIKRLITEDFKTGKTSAEEELDVDLPFNDPMQQKVNQLYEQQINGYTINGELWPGIKGVTKEIQFKTIKIVQDGIMENKSLKEVTAEIENSFNTFTNARSRAIARTETNRIINNGLLTTYKEAGIKLDIDLGKSVDKNITNRTSPMCHRMIHKYGDIVIPLSSMFIDDEGEGATMQSFMSPPFHVNCVRRIVSREIPKKSTKS